MNKYIITTEEDIYLVKAHSSFEAILKVLHYNGDDFGIIKELSKSLDLFKFVDVVNHYILNYNIVSVSQVELVNLYGKSYGASITVIGF